MAGWQDRPLGIDVEKGEKKAFCTCGASKNGPFCDGSHAGTDKRPKIVTFDETKKIHACMCRKSGNGPFCDGSHAKA